MYVIKENNAIVTSRTINTSLLMLFSSILGSVTGLMGMSIFFMVKIEKVTEKVKGRIETKRKLAELKENREMIRISDTTYEKDRIYTFSKNQSSINPQIMAFKVEDML